MGVASRPNLKFEFISTACMQDQFGVSDGRKGVLPDAK